MKLNLQAVKQRVLDGIERVVDFGEEIGKGKLIFRANQLAQQRRLWSLRAQRAKELGVKAEEVPPPDLLDIAIQSHIGTTFLGWSDETVIELGEDGSALACRTADGEIDEKALELFLSLPPVRDAVIAEINLLLELERGDTEGKGKRSSSKSTGK